MYDSNALPSLYDHKISIRAQHENRSTSLTFFLSRPITQAPDDDCQQSNQVVQESLTFGFPRTASPRAALSSLRMESDIATRIRTARRIAGITQAELASQLRVTRSAVANWERVSGIWPATSRILSIAVITGVSYEWLATGRGVPTDDTLPAAVAGELIDDPKELRLLRAFRGCHSAIRRALLEMAESQRHRRA